MLEIYVNYIFVFAVGLGFVAGLRSLTAPAAVSWAAHLGVLNLRHSPLAFMGSTAAVAILTLLAAGEYVADLLPKTPKRTLPGPLIARIVTGGLSAACLFASNNKSILVGALLGGIGAVIGAFAGYETRKRLVHGLKVKDAVIAIPEDLIALSLAYYLVF
jgi:uncharacterized membrane protein